MTRHVTNLFVRPFRPRHHNPRCDTAQLGRHGLVQHRGSCSLVLLLKFRRVAPHDGVMSLRTAGHVYAVHKRTVQQGVRLFEVNLARRKETCIDQVGKNLIEIPSAKVAERVMLQ